MAHPNIPPIRAGGIRRTAVSAAPTTHCVVRKGPDAQDLCDCGEPAVGTGDPSPGNLHTCC
jgi:hypothetical protein